MVSGWGSARSDRTTDQHDDRSDLPAGGEEGSVVRQQAEWDRFVGHHIAEVWSQAAAEGLCRTDALQVCELVWRNAAQRLPALIASSDARGDLLTDVTREARRVTRLRVLTLGRDAPRQRTIRLADDTASVAAPARATHGR
jgi:hypothetical protein